MSNYADLNCLPSVLTAEQDAAYENGKAYGLEGHSKPSGKGCMSHVRANLRCYWMSGYRQGASLLMDATVEVAK